MPQTRRVTRATDAPTAEPATSLSAADVGQPAAHGGEGFAEALLRFSGDAIVAIDADQRIVVFNPKAEEMFGWREAELLGEPLLRLIPERFHAGHADAVRHFARGTGPSRMMGERSEITARRRDGGEFPAEASIFRVENGGRVAFATTLRDVSERKARERELERGRQRFQALFDLSYQFIGMLSPDGTVLEVSQSALDFIAARIEDVRGSAFLDTPWFRDNPEARARLADALARARAGEMPHGEVVMRTPGGEDRTFDFSVRGVADETGALSFLIAEARDITEIARASAALTLSEGRLRHAQRIARMGNWYWDVAKGELSWSDEIYRIFGHPPDHFPATYDAFIAAVHPDDRDQVRAAIAAALRGGAPYSLHHRIVRPGGEVRIVREEAEIARDADGNAIAMAGICQDVTESKETEARLIAARQEAETANAAKTQFLATMSHELRTPLNAVIGFAQLLEQESFGPLGNQKYPAFAGHIRESGEHLLSLVNDVLDVSRIASGDYALELEATHPRDAVAAALPKFVPRAREKQLRLRARVPRTLPRVLGDVRALRQVLLNLLSNALKFTPAGGRVEVTGRIAEDGLVELTVADSGCGIAAEDVPRLGTAFRRLGNAHNADGQGAGLGLAIVRGLAEKMGGRLDIDSAPGEGTRVRVALPRADVAESGAL